MKTATTLLLLCSSAIAQAQAPACSPDLCHFRVDEARHYTLSGLPGGSGLLFYSQTGGGQLIRTAATGADGTLRFTAEQSFTPAFVLSKAASANPEAPATSQVYFYKAPAFALTDLSLEGGPDGAVIRWNAEAANEAAVAFVVEGFNEQEGWRSLNTLSAYNSADVQPYQYAPAGGREYSLYRLAVWTGSTLRYTSPAMRADGGLTLWPTLASNQVHLFKAESTESYTVVDAAGTLVRSGRLLHGAADIDVQALAAGTYTVVLEGGQMWNAARFIRR